MKLYLYLVLSLVTIIACSEKPAQIQHADLTSVNRTAQVKNDAANTISLDAKPGAGMAIIETMDFATGTINLELKGENKPGESFVGLAYNVQNDTTYEAIYFRPFNFQSEEKIRREHSVQYVYDLKYGWRYLRTNFEGKYESEYTRQPNPDEWFAVSLKIDEKEVVVVDATTNDELLRVERLEKQLSNKIAFWVGHGSKGTFRNLKITK